MQEAIGIDIGGTKIAVAAISEKGEMTGKVTVPSQTDTAETMYAAVTGAIDHFLAQSHTTIEDYQGIGLGVPGKVNRQAGIALFQNNLPWQEFPIAARLEATYGKRPLQIDNDVYQAAFAEWQASKVNREAVFVYYTISTGVACAIINNGDFLRGNGFAGEVGLAQVIDPREGKKIARLEGLASGPAITQAGQRYYQNNQLTTAELFARYQQGDPFALALINQMIDSITHSVYSIICLIDPAAIVFGGSLSLYQPFLIEGIKQRLTSYAIAPQLPAVDRLHLSQLSNNAGIIGAGLQLLRSQNKGID